MQKVVLFWFRRDLRLSDNTGLSAALQSGFPVVPLFIFDKAILRQLEDKDDKRVSFIYTALQHLQKQLVAAGSTLEVRDGNVEDVFSILVNAYDVQAVYANQDYEPSALQRDGSVKTFLAKKNIRFHLYKDQVIFEKNEVVKEDGSNYMVFTPYARKWKALLQKDRFSTSLRSDSCSAFTASNLCNFLHLSRSVLFSIRPFRHCPVSMKRKLSTMTKQGIRRPSPAQRKWVFTCGLVPSAFANWWRRPCR